MTGETIGGAFSTRYILGEFLNGVLETRSHLEMVFPQLVFGMIHRRIDMITIIHTRKKFTTRDRSRGKSGPPKLLDRIGETRKTLGVSGANISGNE